MEFTKLDVEKIVANNPEIKEIVVPEGVTEIGENAFKDANKSLESVVLPSTLVKIGEYAFTYCEHLKAVKIPESVKEIGEKAFENCKSLEECNIPEGITEIKDRTFDSTALKHITLPKSIKKIGVCAFSSAPLEELVLPEGIEEIGQGAFSHTKIKEVAFPKSLKKILTAFEYCENLEKVEITKTIAENTTKEGKCIEDNFTNSFSFSGCSSLKEVILCEGLEGVPEHAFYRCAIKEIKLPSTLKKIGYDAFSINQIESITFPQGIEEVAGFNYNPLKEVVIPEGVKIVGYSAFKSCENLKSIQLPSTLEEIGSYAFSECPNLKSIQLPSTLEKISSSAFEKCKNLEVITLGENITVIGDRAFNGCTSLKEIKLPKTLKSLNNKAFMDCTSLSEIEIPENIEESRFDFYMFFVGSSVKEVRWLTNAEAKNCCFGGSPFLEEVYVNASTIKKEAFYINNLNSRDAKIQNCPVLKKLIIGKDVEKIEDGAFFGLDNLSEIIVEEGNTKYVFESGSLYAKGTKRLVRAVPVGEKDGKKLYQIAEKVKAIGEGAFPRSVEEAEVEFLGKIEKVNDKAVDGYSKGSWKKENQIENAKGGAKTVYDAMNFVNAKAAKIDSVKKATADALVKVALSDWQYGFDENKGSSPSRTVYRVKLPFDAAFIINMKTKPTQKDAQAVFDAINALKAITDEAELFEKVRKLSAESEISVKGGNGDKKLFEFSGVRHYPSSKEIESSEGLPSVSFIEKDVEKFFEGSGLEWQSSVIPDKDNRLPKVEIAVRKDGKILSVVWNHWSIFDNAKYGARAELKSFVSIVKDNDVSNLEAAIAEAKFNNSNGVLMFSE